MTLPASVTDQEGLRVLLDVSHVLVQGLPSEETVAGVGAVLRRNLGVVDCRIWIRAADGRSYRLMRAPTEPRPAVEDGSHVPGWVARGVHREEVTSGVMLRQPLVHDAEPFGLMEARLDLGGAGRESMVRDVLLVVANMLAPLLATVELSEDLAAEVVLRAREIENQRRFTARIVDSLPVSLYVVDRDYRIQAWNSQRETGTQGISREDAIGRTVFEVLTRQPRDLLQEEFDEVFRRGEIRQVEMESRAEGQPRYYRVTKIPMRLDDQEVTHVITIAEEITERVEAQHQVAQAEKLAAVGQLAAGVMHEINNPLATIQACTEALVFATEAIPADQRASAQEYLGIIDTEVQRCKRIVEGLLDFSHPKARAKRPEHVNRLVEQTLFLLKHHDRFKRVRTVQDVAPGLPPVLADGERLVQCFMALMLNAMDAMGPGGTLTVRTQRNPQRADEVMAEFIDTGQGISQQDLPKIFEPFYTTKVPGRGTGLGLSVCYAIVSDHRGRIEVESQVGRGSNFQVFLPVA
ncbi:MAG: two-component system sensor histidine kinase NtrB [Gemmatimonadales bacterium]